MIRHSLLLLLYWSVIVPVAFISRVMPDPLRRSLDSTASTYWAWQSGQPAVRQDGVL